MKGVEREGLESGSESEMTGRVRKVSIGVSKAQVGLNMLSCVFEPRHKRVRGRRHAARELAPGPMAEAASAVAGEARQQPIGTR